MANIIKLTFTTSVSLASSILVEPEIEIGEKKDCVWGWAFDVVAD